MARVSIIVPAYNAQNFLPRAVESVRAQTYGDWELILVDDGSRDETPALCDRFAAEDSRIRVLHQENAGVSTARNNGIALAQSELIAFLDADDWFVPTFLEKMLHALDANGADCACCGHWNTYEDGREVYDAPPLPAGLYTDEELLTGVVLPLLSDRVSANLFGGFIWRYLFSRKTIVENNILFDGAYLEDEIFLIAYFSCPGALAVVDEGLYHYLQNSQSVTKRYLLSYVPTFMNSLAHKQSLVERYAIPAPAWWVDNTCWAGLLIAVSNVFAPGNDASFGEKVRDVREICKLPAFSHAIGHYKPTGMARNKTIVAALIRARLYTALGLLYTYKNRNR